MWLGANKFSYLNQLPWLLARVLGPGVKGQCLQQWASCRPEQHHRLTRHFLSPASRLRQAIDYLHVERSNASQYLRDEVVPLAAFPMDDNVEEGPHAVARTVKQRPRPAGFSWIAATMRARQNLDDVRSWVPALDCDLKQDRRAIIIVVCV